MSLRRPTSTFLKKSDGDGFVRTMPVQRSASPNRLEGDGFALRLRTQLLCGVLFLVAATGLVLLADKQVIRSLAFDSHSFLRNGMGTAVAPMGFTADIQPDQELLPRHKEQQQQQQQQHQQENGQPNDLTAEKEATDPAKQMKRPHLLLHVGPQKTGSSTLQSAWDIMWRYLEDDNYHVEHVTPEHGDFECDIGPWGGFRDCKPGQILKDAIAQAHEMGQNLILSDENLDHRFVEPLRELIDDNLWQVKVVVMYRHIHEWLISWYNQINKTTNVDSDGKVLIDDEGNPYRVEHTRWPEQGGVYVKPFIEWYKEFVQYWDPEELVEKHRSLEFFNLYKAVFPDQVIVYNMNEEMGDLVTNFMCRFLEEAPNSCGALENNQVELPMVNPSVKLRHDILAVAAYEDGLINSDLSRQEVVAAISAYVNEQNVQLPIQCDSEVVDQIRDWLLGSFEAMFPGSSSDEKRDELKDVFESFMKTGKLCDINVEMTLEDENWKTFFQSLSGIEQGDDESSAENEEISTNVEPAFVESNDQLQGGGEEEVQPTSPETTVVVSEENENMVDHRLNLVLHVGPKKTGSTSLQRFLSGWLAPDLAQDNYQFRWINTQFGFFDCEVVGGGFQNCRASEQLKTLLSQSAETRQQLILSDENLDERFVDALKNVIDTSVWMVKVVVVYRRLPEWLVSVYNEDQKNTNLDQSGNILIKESGHPYRTPHFFWPGQGGRAILQFPQWFDEYTTARIADNEDVDMAKIHQGVNFLNLYKSRSFEKVTFFDFYQDGSLEETFVCDMVPGATNACNAIRNDGKQAQTQNQSTNLDPEILAVAAYEKDLVNKKLGRQDVVGRVGEHLQNTQKSLPKLCDPELSKKLYDWLVESEKQMYGDEWTPRRVGSLNQVYEAFVKRGYICSVDVDMALQDPFWVDFFTTMH